MSEDAGADARLDVTSCFQPDLACIVKKVRMTESMILLNVQLEDGQPLGHEPGQFLQISLPGYGEAPISLCSSPTQEQSFEMCVQAVGNLSVAMHDLRPGDFVGVRGPYGHGFPVADMQGHDVLLVAGGIGVAPLKSLIDYVMHRRDEFERVTIIYGARTPDDLLFQGELAKWEAADNVDTYITIDTPAEGWTGLTGVVTLPLRDLEIDAPNTVAAGSLCVPGRAGVSLHRSGGAFGGHGGLGTRGRRLAEPRAGGNGDAQTTDSVLRLRLLRGVPTHGAAA